MLVFSKTHFEREFLKYFGKNLSDQKSYKFTKNYSFLNLVHMQDHVLNLGKNSKLNRSFDLL